MFKDDMLYRTDDEALAVIGTRGTLSQLRHRGEGPPYIRLSRNRIVYSGKDLNEYILDRKIEPRNNDNSI